MIRLLGILAIGAQLSCLPPRQPSVSYGEALRACDSRQTETEWVECCVAAARSYGQDPNFCFQ